ncbi:hypothetical protein HCFMJIKG_01931 [Streptococcus equi subsp. zooepidemicus]|nr:hypothetical protein HCFMJIKG_01931 [Streptococcus equi subsp. zooepidemicus]
MPLVSAVQLDQRAIQAKPDQEVSKAQPDKLENVDQRVTQVLQALKEKRVILVQLVLKVKKVIPEQLDLKETKANAAKKASKANAAKKVSKAKRVSKEKIQNHQLQKHLKRLLHQKLQRLQSSQLALRHQLLSQHQANQRPQQVKKQSYQPQEKQAIHSLAWQLSASSLAQAC